MAWAAGRVAPAPISPVAVPADPPRRAASALAATGTAASARIACARAQLGRERLEDDFVVGGEQGTFDPGLQPARPGSRQKDRDQARGADVRHRLQQHQHLDLAQWHRRLARPRLGGVVGPEIRGDPANHGDDVVARIAELVSGPPDTGADDEREGGGRGPRRPCQTPARDEPA
jgi:hypothetical protein